MTIKVFSAFLLINIGTGRKNYFGYEIISFTLENDSQATLVANLTVKFNIDWLYPHRHSVRIGQEIRLMLEPNDKGRILHMMAAYKVRRCV